MTIKRHDFQAHFLGKDEKSVKLIHMKEFGKKNTNKRESRVLYLKW